MASTILIVDDSADYRRILSRTVVSGGYRALTASCAEEARLLLRTSPPDAVLLDWNLPGVNGIELAREIRSEPRLARMPLLMLSVNARAEEQVQGLREGGVDAYLVKPVDAAELLARLKALLERPGRAKYI